MHLFKLPLAILVAFGTLSGGRMVGRIGALVKGETFNHITNSLWQCTAYLLDSGGQRLEPS